MKPIIYLVDDDETFNFITKKVICKHLSNNCVIKEFTDPEEAVQSYLEENQKPSYIFLDIQMPLMDGWEVLEILNEEIPGFEKLTNVIMLTSSILPTDKEKADANQAVSHYLNKPLNQIDVQFVFNKDLKPELIN